MELFIVCGLILLAILLVWSRLVGPPPPTPQDRYRRTAGQAGEQAVRTLLAQLPLGAAAVVLHDVTLPDPEGGLVQMDHILLSTAGILVLETKQWSGTIDASPRAPHWLQWFPDGTVRHYQNPLYQNNLHLRVVRYALARVLPPHVSAQEVVQGLVVFTGSAQPLGRWPVGVGDLVWLRQILSRSSRLVLTARDIQRCTDHLHALRLVPGLQTDRRHLRSLHRRHGRSSWF